MRQGCPEIARPASWYQRLRRALSGGFVCKDPRRGERDQSAEDGPRTEPAIVPHWTENKASGRRHYAGSPAVGIRGSPRGLFLGTEREAPCGAQQEDQRGSGGTARCSEPDLS